MKIHVVNSRTGKRTWANTQWDQGWALTNKQLRNAATVVEFQTGDVLTFEPTPTDVLFDLEGVIKKTVYEERDSFCIRWDPPVYSHNS